MMISKKIINISFVLIAGLILSTSCLKNDVEERTAADGVKDFEDYISLLVAEGYDVLETTNGVKYVVVEEGEGDFPQEGDTLSISYDGYFTGGGLFDTSDPYDQGDTFDFIFKVQPMIDGFEEGLSIMNEGAVHELIIPYELAYGEAGSGYTIPPYTPLVFVVKMNEIKPAGSQD